MRIKSRTRLRIRRPWRGYAVGTVISPPGMLRGVLVSGKNPIAEIIEDKEELPAVEAPIPQDEPPDDEDDGPTVARSRKRRKTTDDE